MQHFTAWAFAWAICLTLAALLAWAITSEPAEPYGRHRSGNRQSIRLDLAGQRRAGWDRNEPKPVRPLNSLPLCSGIGQPIPAHLLARTIIPKPPVVHGRAHLVRVQEAPALPVAVAVRVVPLWERQEEQRRTARRQALEAIAAGLPDPGYTFPGAHVLAAA